MEIKKFFDKSKDKTIISEVDDDKPRSTAKSGYQSITTGATFKRSHSKNGSSDQPKEYNYKTVTDESGKTLKFRKPKDEPDDEIDNRKHFSLDIRPDGMSATIVMFKDDVFSPNREDILDFLHENRIEYGINNDTINELLSDNYFYDELPIAEGTPAIDGKDGFFDYTFDITPPTKPIVQEDGSVDYNTLGKYELVYKDQLLATYIPSAPGKDGKNIFGDVIKAKVPVDYPPLKLDNVDYEADNQEYYSIIEGNATLENGTLKVTPVFVVDGNLEAATGNVDFRGDVIVKGNVFSNVTIKTTGNITINGHVEIAKLISGKDILLKNGMQGSGTGRIKCGGNLIAKFLEQTTIHCDGDVKTNAILNCNITSGGSINVSGRPGTILGGYVCSAREIDCHTIGNRAGVQTKIVIGLETDFKTAMFKVEQDIADYSDKVNKTSRELEKIIKEMQTSKNPALAKQKLKYMREAVTHLGLLNDSKNKKKFILEIREQNIDGTVITHGPVYTGTTVIINGISETINSEYKNVTFTKTPKELKIKSNSIDDSAPRKKPRR